MRISKRHAFLIREGIFMANLHMKAMLAASGPGSSPEILVLAMEFVGKTMPRHPLTLRAYVRTVDHRHQRVQNNMKVMQQNIKDVSHNLAKIMNEDNVFKGETEGRPEAPEIPKNNIRIADGFHD